MSRREYLNGGAYATARRGNELPHAKLNPELVRAIRANRHGLTARQWAVRLRLHIRTIEAVQTFKNWKQV